jgi:hypothetical protein
MLGRKPWNKQVLFKDLIPPLLSCTNSLNLMNPIAKWGEKHTCTLGNPQPLRILEPQLEEWAQVVEHLPSKENPLSSNPSTIKKKKNPGE